MIPHMSENDLVMFYKYLDNTTIYFEFGSGGSTYQANLRDNIKKIYSVESDKSWHNKLKSIVKNDKITYIYNEMDSRENTWGYPGINSTYKQFINYSNQILNIKDNIDFILIDGRFRVACALKCFNLISDNCYIAFDDFLNRQYYHVILNFYNIIEKTKDNRMVILQKKRDVIVPEHLIRKYEGIYF